jgi:hypothetical protein
MDDVCFATVKVVVDLLAPLQTEESLLDMGGRMKNLETTENTLEILRTLYKAKLKSLRNRNQEEMQDAVRDTSD